MGRLGIASTELRHRGSLRVPSAPAAVGKWIGGVWSSAGGRRGVVALAAAMVDGRWEGEERDERGEQSVSRPHHSMSCIHDGNEGKGKYQVM